MWMRNVGLSVLALLLAVLWISTSSAEIPRIIN